MAVIQQITLRRDFGKVPKGTAVRIVTSSEADHSMSMVYRALRKEGFADDDFRGIGTSAYWDWEVVPGDATALHNELERYSVPVASKKADSGTKDKKRSSKSSKSSSGKESSVGHFILRCLDLDDEAETRRQKEAEERLKRHEESLKTQKEQCRIHRAEEAKFAEVLPVSFNPDDRASVEEAIKACDEYLEVAKNAQRNRNALYYGADDEYKLETAREKEIKANAKTIETKRDEAKSALKELKKKSKDPNDKSLFGGLEGMGGVSDLMKGSKQMFNSPGANMPKRPKTADGAKKGGCGPKVAAVALLIIAICVFI